MRRVINRLMFGAEPVSEPEVLAAARMLLPTGKGWEWNQALIEFGALQCTARKPACIVCPLRTVCAAAPTIQTTLALKRTKGARAPDAPFETTSRYYRGRIVEALRDLPPENREGITLSQLGPQVKVGYSESDSNWLRGLVEGLQRDGLAVIAEETPQYQVGEPPIVEASRVKLP
jgi:A/G-specific adenine glycosylase